MHRSGTSMIAGLLQLCGVFLGQNLLGQAKSNSKGHFEDRNFLQFNIDLLKASGGSWDKPPRTIMQTGPLFEQKMTEFISSWPKSRIVAWKDPRACLTLHIWKRLIEPEETRIILVTRPADEIAKSLNKRNNFSLERGEVLAFQYQKNALMNIDKVKVKWRAAHYPLFLTHLKKELKELLKFLGLEMPENTGDLERFVEPSMRHFWEQK